MKPIRTCSHIKTNGIVCGSPALREHELCYFHHQQQERAKLRFRVGFPFDPTIHVHTFEEPESVQLALAEITHAVLDRRLDTRRAKVVLHALQLAIHNFKYLDRKPDPQKMSTDLPVDSLIPGAEVTRATLPEYPCREEEPEPRKKPVHSVRASAAASTATLSSTRPAASTHNPSLPAQIERDIAAARSGDVSAAKRLLSYLPSSSQTPQTDTPHAPHENSKICKSNL